MTAHRSCPGGLTLTAPRVEHAPSRSGKRLQDLQSSVAETGCCGTGTRRFSSSNQGRTTVPLISALLSVKSCCSYLSFSRAANLDRTPLAGAPSHPLSSRRDQSLQLRGPVLHHDKVKIRRHLSITRCISDHEKPAIVRRDIDHRSATSTRSEIERPFVDNRRRRTC